MAGVGTILLGNLIVLVPMLLNAHAGAKYGIPFPVFVRASFGVRGANLPAVLRALVACGWFGIQTWIGGQAIHSMLADPVARRRRLPGAGLDLLLRVLAAQYAVIWQGIETIRFLEGIGAPFMLGVGCCCCGGSPARRAASDPCSARRASFRTRRAFFAFLRSVAHRDGRLLGDGRLNIPDFTRYAKSQRAQMLGPGAGLPTAMTLYSFIGVAVTSASVVLFGEAIWDPVALIGRFHQPLVAFIALIAILIATLNTNVAANVVSPSNDFSNLNPRLISFRTGGMITGVVGVMMMPWKLLGDYSSYIFGWLVGYSGLLGPIAGTMIADYFIVRGSELAQCGRSLPPRRRYTNIATASIRGRW